MLQSRSLKQTIFEQSSFCLCSVWPPLAVAPVSLATAISFQPGAELRIGRDRLIVRPIGMKTLAMTGGIENKSSPPRRKKHEAL